MAGYETALDLNRTFAQPTSSRSSPAGPSDMDSVSSCLSLAFAPAKPNPLSPHQATPGGHDRCNYIDASASIGHQGGNMRRYSSEDSNQQLRSEWVTLSKTMLMMLVERICQISFDNDGKSTTSMNNEPTTTTTTMMMMSEGNIITRDTKDGSNNSRETFVQQQQQQQLQQQQQQQQLQGEPRQEKEFNEEEAVQESGQQELTTPQELRQRELGLREEEFQEQKHQELNQNKTRTMEVGLSYGMDPNLRSSVPMVPVVSTIPLIPTISVATTVPVAPTVPVVPSTSCDESLSPGTVVCSAQDSTLNKEANISKHCWTLSDGNHNDSLEPYDCVESIDCRKSKVSERRKQRPFKSTAGKCRKKTKKSFNRLLNRSIQPWVALNKSIVYRMFDSVLNPTSSQCQAPLQTTASQCQVPSQAMASQCQVPLQTMASQCQVPSQTMASQCHVPSQTMASQCQMPSQETTSQCQLPSQSQEVAFTFTTLRDRYFFCGDQLRQGGEGFTSPGQKDNEGLTSDNCWKSGEALEQQRAPPPPNLPDAICETPLLGALLCRDDVTVGCNDVTNRRKTQIRHHRFSDATVPCRSCEVGWPNQGTLTKAAFCPWFETIENCSPQSMPVDYSNNSNDNRTTFDGRWRSREGSLESKGVVEVPLGNASAPSPSPSPSPSPAPAPALASISGAGRRPRWIAVDKHEMCSLVESLVSTMMSEDDVTQKKITRWRDVRSLSNDECGRPMQKDNDSKSRCHGSGRHDDDRLESAEDLDIQRHSPGVVASSQDPPPLGPGERGRKQKTTKRAEEDRKKIHHDKKVVLCPMKWKSNMLRRLHSQALLGNDDLTADSERLETEEEEDDKTTTEGRGKLVL